MRKLVPGNAINAVRAKAGTFLRRMIVPFTKVHRLIFRLLKERLWTSTEFGETLDGQVLMATQMRTKPEHLCSTAARFDMAQVSAALVLFFGGCSPFRFIAGH